MIITIRTICNHEWSIMSLIIMVHYDRFWHGSFWSLLIPTVKLWWLTFEVQMDSLPSINLWTWKIVVSHRSFCCSVDDDVSSVTPYHHRHESSYVIMMNYHHVYPAICCFYPYHSWLLQHSRETWKWLISVIVVDQRDCGWPFTCASAAS